VGFEFEFEFEFETGSDEPAVELAVMTGCWLGNFSHRDPE
jgi:hypothetical protein